MKIASGCDPNATEYKTILTPFIESLGHECVYFRSDDPIYANPDSVWLRLSLQGSVNGEFSSAERVSVYVSLQIK